MSTITWSVVITVVSILVLSVDAGGVVDADNDHGISSLVMQLQMKDLNENACSRMKKSETELIIDIQKSLKHGAKLLEAETSEDVLNCSNLCCNNPMCDLGVYKVPGDGKGSDTSSGGIGAHNCFLIHCGNPANCKMAHHSEFVAMMFYSTNGVGTYVPPKPSYVYGYVCV